MAENRICFVNLIENLMLLCYIIREISCPEFHLLKCIIKIFMTMKADVCSYMQQIILNKQINYLKIAIP